KNVTVQVCHPGASRTNLLKDTASAFNKIVWSILSRIIAQSAEKGSWPEVMCATEANVESEKLYGPTKRSQTVGPIDECPLNACALNREAATKLWVLSEQETSLRWSP
ncbi:MAG: oxidoreductase, partial [Pirellulaceae bacterium]